MVFIVCSSQSRLAHNNEQTKSPNKQLTSMFVFTFLGYANFLYLSDCCRYSHSVCSMDFCTSYRPWPVNFTKLLLSFSSRYDPQKGFHCLREGIRFPKWSNSHLSPHRRCLGSGKGRQYPRLNRNSEVIRTLYRAANQQLIDLLRNQPSWRSWLSKVSGFDYPKWLLSRAASDWPFPISV